MDWETAFFLGVEQCPADIETARQGQETTSFNPEIGVTNPGCVYDFVQVDASTYYGNSQGATITFAGEIGETLHK